MNGKKTRFSLVDEYRGFWIVNMIIYHAIWDLVYIYGVKWSWFKSDYVLLWERIGASSFIFIAGFCWLMSRHNFKRGLMVYGAGMVISAVTLIFMPDSRVVFGILTFLGSAMLLMIPLDVLFQKINSLVGIISSLFLFLFAFPISRGYLGFGECKLIELPDAWYGNFFSTYLGLKEKGFYSTDYFALFPWFFMFVAGYFAYRYVFLENRKQGSVIQGFLGQSVSKPLGWIGRNSLIIYMIHQPVVYGVLWVIDFIWRI